MKLIILAMSLFLGLPLLAADMWDDTNAAIKIEQAFSDACKGKGNAGIGINLYPYSSLGRRIDIGQNVVSITCKGGQPSMIYIQPRNKISDGVYLCLNCIM